MLVTIFLASHRERIPPNGSLSWPSVGVREPGQPVYMLLPYYYHATCHTRESHLNATPGWEAAMDILAVNMVLPTVFQDKLDYQVFQAFG